MATLDRVTEMKKQGLSDTEISSKLQVEGVPSSEINDSLNQSKMGNAPSAAPQIPNEEMQSSIMGNNAVAETRGDPNQAAQPPAPGKPMTQEMPAPQTPQQPEVYPPQQQYEQPQPGQDQYAQQQPVDEYYQQTPQYSDQGYYAPQQGSFDTETISEIAEQVVSDKFSEFHKKTGDIPSFKNQIQDKVSDIDNRLKKIEDNIDKLQQAIIGKIGEFGESSAMVHKDLDNLHGTMSKLMNPLIDNVNEMRKNSN